MNLVALSLAPPAEESGLVILRRGERRQYFSELDDQYEAERALLTGVPFRARRGRVRRTEGVYACVHAERCRATTGQLAAHVVDLLNRREVVGRVELTADVTATGVGALAAFRERGLEVRPATIVEGRVRGTLSRRNLEQTLVTVLEQGRLKIASALPLSGALADELKVKEGRLCAALMLACWRGEQFTGYDPAAWAVGC